ncbi:50S ribosomal protein L29 [Sinomonas susongensis]|uniref:50S ribosomal protein L29 n=1 Tax=Sinomonas susongensis TaxID=1324851 RepID=UPI0011086A8A|nr:50S ribosomal protein L29 [Sinomonas susongensis]
MAVGSKDLTAEKLDQLDSERLLEELKKAKEELFNLRFQSATGQLESHGRLGTVKKDIARIYTVLRERELGIRVEPTSADEGPKDAKKSKKAAKAAANAEAQTEATTDEAEEAK